MIVVGYDPSTKMVTLQGSNGPEGTGIVYTRTWSLDDFYSKHY